MNRRSTSSRQMQLLLPIMGVLIVVVVALVLFGNRLGFLGGTALSLPDPSFPKISNIAPGLDEQQLVRAVTWQALKTGSSGACAGWLSYHSNEDGRWDLYRVMLNDERSIINLSRGTGTTSSITPATSPNGEYIAFSTDRDGNWEIYVINVDGSNMQRVTWNTSAIERDPVWSPDGKAVIYETTRHGNWDLYQMDVATGEETRLTTTPANESAADFSPDGSKLLYISDVDEIPQIYELDLTSGRSTLLSDSIGEDTEPTYSPDGQQILFTSVRDEGKLGLYTMNSDGSNLAAVSDPAVESYNGVWSSVNGMIAYETHRGDQSMIMVYQPDGALTRQLTSAADRSYAPMWICDGQQLAFTSDIGGNADIYLTSVGTDMAAPPIDVRREAKALTSTPASERYPFSVPNKENASRRASLPNSPAAISVAPTATW